MKLDRLAAIAAVKAKLAGVKAAEAARRKKANLNGVREARRQLRHAERQYRRAMAGKYVYYDHWKLAHRREVESIRGLLRLLSLTTGKTVTVSGLKGLAELLSK